MIELRQYLSLMNHLKNLEALASDFSKRESLPEATETLCREFQQLLDGPLRTLPEYIELLHQLYGPLLPDDTINQSLPFLLHYYSGYTFSTLLQEPMDHFISLFQHWQKENNNA